MSRFEIGDRVRLAKDSPLLSSRAELAGKVGLVVALEEESSKLYRISVEYDGVLEFEKMYADFFEYA